MELLPDRPKNQALLTPVARADDQHTEMDAMFETPVEGAGTSGCSRICLRGDIAIGKIKTSRNDRRPLQAPDTNG
jgi:hypothetical protein